MKKLFLVRHAKSDRSIAGLDDLFRPLNARGYNDAPGMASQIAIHMNERTLFVSSPAVRAWSTALIFAVTVGYDDERIEIFSDLYETGPREYINRINLTSEEYDTLFLFGHNPSVSETIGRLTGTGGTDVPTCAITGLEFQAATWKECHSGKAREFLQIFPKKTGGLTNF